MQNSASDTVLDLTVKSATHVRKPCQAQTAVMSSPAEASTPTVAEVATPCPTDARVLLEQDKNATTALASAHQVLAMQNSDFTVKSATHVRKPSQAQTAVMSSPAEASTPIDFSTPDNLQEGELTAVSFRAGFRVVKNRYMISNALSIIS